MLCDTIPHHTVPYRTLPYGPYRTVPYHTIPYHTILYYTVYDTILYKHSNIQNSNSQTSQTFRHSKIPMFEKAWCDTGTRFTHWLLEGLNVWNVWNVEICGALNVWLINVRSIYKQWHYKYFQHSRIQTKIQTPKDANNSNIQIPRCFKHSKIQSLRSRTFHALTPHSLKFLVRAYTQPHTHLDLSHSPSLSFCAFVDIYIYIYLQIDY